MNLFNRIKRKLVGRYPIDPSKLWEFHTELLNSLWPYVKGVEKFDSLALSGLAHSAIYEAVILTSRSQSEVSPARYAKMIGDSKNGSQIIPHVWELSGVLSEDFHRMKSTPNSFPRLLKGEIEKRVFRVPEINKSNEDISANSHLMTTHYVRMFYKAAEYLQGAM